MAESANEEELANDIEYLRKIWRDIKEHAKRSAPPSMLYQELSLGAARAARLRQSGNRPHRHRLA